MEHDRHDGHDTPASIGAIQDAVIGLVAKTLAAAARSRDCFVHLATNAVWYELEAANIALRRGRTEQVKAFALGVRLDYEKIATELKSFSAGGGTAQPAAVEVDAPFQPFRTLIDDLARVPDRDFDARYAVQQRAVNSAVVTLFRSYRGGGGDGGLTRLCRHGLPLLERSQEEADRLAGSF